MDGQSFSQALVKLSGDDLRMVYALLCKTNIFNLITTKTRDVFSSSESNHFTKHLEEEAKKLRVKSDDELRLDLFLELTKIAQIRGGRYDLQKEVEDKCQEIVDWVFIEFQKRNKNFQQYYQEKDFTKLEAMINWQMNQVFKEMDLKLTKLTDKDQDELASKVIGYINALPSEQQEKIKEKLGVQEISNKVVTSVIAQSGASVLFATIVEVSGFAFYTSATSALAAFVGIFGITLPFSAYTTLTSTIAFLASPLVMLPLILGGGILLVNHQNKNLTKRLVPIVLMQITLPYFANTEMVYQDISVICNQWNPKFERYKQLHKDLKKNQEELKIINREIDGLKHDLEVKETDKRNLEKNVFFLKRNIIEQLRKDKNCPDFEGLTTTIQLLQGKIVQFQEKIKLEREANAGFFGSIKTVFKTNGYQSEITNLKRKVDQAYVKMVETILKGRLDYASEQVDQIYAFESEILSLQKTISTLQIDLTGKNKELTILKTKASSIRPAIIKKESETYGLEHIVLT